MKKRASFWGAFERYTWRVTERAPLPYFVIATGLALLVIVTSMFGKSLVGVQSREEAIKRAAEAGDYGLAEELYQTGEEQVLGVRSELEEVVYPVKKIEARIRELEARLGEYPGNREIYLELAGLYRQSGKVEEAKRYAEMARVLDPNE